MKTELLCPAGTLKSMNYAFAYGADAVYAGQPRYSLRVRNNEFNKLENLASAIEEAHQKERLFYIASNLAPHNNKVRTYLRDMEEVVAMGPDALIMSDPGLIMLVRERWPEMPIHLSVQANVVNYAAVKFWQGIGLKRIILSRELSLDEIAEIRQQCPDIELETFVHGALCIAYSGRCLLSGYMTHRDSNQGACTNSCRWKYDAHEADETPEGNIEARAPVIERPLAEQAGSESDSVYLLQEEGRPGEYLPAFEDEHGTYIMNSKDLRAIQHVQRLVEMGIDSLKIEGRTKSHFYVARTAQLYRRAIDDALAGRQFDMGLMDQLESLSNRGYTEGFYRRHPPAEFQNYESGRSTSNRHQFVGEVTAVNDDQSISIEVKNRFAVGDLIELMTPTGNIEFRLAEMVRERNGETLDVAPGSGHRVRIPLPPEMAAANVDKGLLLRSLDKVESVETGASR
ncbi:MAG: tRNA 5-hydroxyuridine modification protein YegQ [Gammaproteobacteria bacterium]|nr:tRNA 5-hydroxyuridine modification protein YegQ [Gammaproteobacteria bacterium]